MLNLEAADPNMKIMLTKKLQKEIPQEYQIKVGNQVMLDRDRYYNEVVDPDPAPPPDPQTWKEFLKVFGDQING